MNSARKRGPTDKQQERDNAKIACMSHLKTALCNAIQGGGCRGGNKSKQLLCKTVLAVSAPKTVNRATHLAVRNKSVF